MHPHRRMQRCAEQINERAAAIDAEGLAVLRETRKALRPVLPRGLRDTTHLTFPDAYENMVDS